MQRVQCMFAGPNGCASIEEHISLYNLRHKKFDEKYFPGAKSTVEILLLRGDMFFQRAISLRPVRLCLKHKNDLLKEYQSTRGRKSCICVPCWKKSSANKSTRHINSAPALTIFETFQYGQSYAKLICDTCRKDIARLTEPVSDICLRPPPHSKIDFRPGTSKRAEIFRICWT